MDASEKIDNALVHQKDELLELIGQGAPHNITTALAVLSRLVELWRVLNYGYKGRECVLRIKAALQAEQATLHHRAVLRRGQISTQLIWCDELIKSFGEGL